MTFVRFSIRWRTSTSLRRQVGRSSVPASAMSGWTRDRGPGRAAMPLCYRCHPDAYPTPLAHRPIVSRAAGLIPRACRRAAPIAIEGGGLAFTPVGGAGTIAQPPDASAGWRRAAQPCRRRFCPFWSKAWRSACDDAGAAAGAAGLVSPRRHCPSLTASMRFSALCRLPATTPG